MDHKIRKKGQVQYFLENAFRIGFLMIALLAFFLLINFYIVNKFDTNKLQSEVIANRLMYSDTFMYEKNARIYTGIVDLSKFEDKDINEDVNYLVKKHAAVRMRLVDNKDSKIEFNASLNKKQYDILYTLVRGKGEGKGSATIYYKIFPVSYLDNSGEYRYGTIYMNIIIPNS